MLVEPVTGTQGEGPLEELAGLVEMPLGVLEAGVYLAPSQFEAGFVSAAHTTEDIAKTVAAAKQAAAA